jgi:hypothetical protein
MKSESTKKVVKKKVKEDTVSLPPSGQIDLGFSKEDVEPKQSSNVHQEENTLKKKKPFQQKNSKKSDEKLTNLPTMGFFVGRIPR